MLQIQSLRTKNEVIYHVTYVIKFRESPKNGIVTIIV